MHLGSANQIHRKKVLDFISTYLTSREYGFTQRQYLKSLNRQRDACSTDLHLRRARFERYIIIILMLVTSCNTRIRSNCNSRSIYLLLSPVNRTILRTLKLAIGTRKSHLISQFSNKQHSKKSVSSRLKFSSLNL